MTSEKQSKEYEAGEMVKFRQCKDVALTGAVICMLVFFLDVAVFAWTVGDFYMSSTETSYHYAKNYSLFFVAMGFIGGALWVIYAVSFLTTVCVKAINGFEWQVFNSIINGFMLAFDICVLAVYWKARFCKDCLIADRAISLPGYATIVVSMFSAAIRVLILLHHSWINGHLSQAKKRIAPAIFIILLLCVLTSGLLSIGLGEHASHKFIPEIDRQVFLVQEVMSFCYNVERRVSNHRGTDIIIAPEGQYPYPPSEEIVGSATVSCCRFYQKVHINTLYEIMVASEGISRRVRCQDSFPFINYLVFPDHMQLLDTHDCTLVVTMLYDKATASLKYNSGLEFRSKTNPDSCIAAGSNLNLGYGHSATEITREDAYMQMNAVKNYECPSNRSCSQVSYGTLDRASQTWTSVQPKDLTSHIGCFTTANQTTSLILGLCQGPPQALHENVYPTVTSCIDDFEYIEAGPYLAYGTH